MPPITRSKALPEAPPASTTKTKPAPRKPNKPKPKSKLKPRSTKPPQIPNPAKISKPQAPPKKKSKSKKKPTNPEPKPKNKPSPAPRHPPTNAGPAEGEEEEEDWELAESYRILPYLTSPDFMPPYLPSKPPSKDRTSNPRATPPARIHARQRTRQTAARPPPIHSSNPIRSNHTSPRVPPTPPPSAAISPAVPDRVHFEDDEGSTLPPKRGQKLKGGSSSSESIKLADIPSYVPSAAGSRTPDPGEGYGLSGAVRNGWEPSLNARDVGMRGQNLPSSFPIEANPQTTQRSRRNPNPKPPSPTPSTPLSLPAAQVFKRPTVNTLRQERAQFHEALGAWMGRLEGVLDVLGGVVGEVRGRMGVLEAVNRVQKPLRRAVLGRGRGRRGR